MDLTILPNKSDVGACGVGEFRTREFKRVLKTLVITGDNHADQQI
jgi:hypothetical protein